MPDLRGKSIGRYRIIKILGEGGMATVYKGFDTRLERDVAIKFIRRGQIGTDLMEEVLKRFEREAKRMAKFNHPNIVAVIDYGEFEGSPYLVMPYLPGGTLSELLKTHHGKPLPFQEAARILVPVARALEYAHEQDTIHRDVKPANILLTDKGVPLLTDFGVAKILDLEEGNTLTGMGMGIGTPTYMAPEQWHNKISPQTDVYSLGVVFYELVTGRVPYDANSPAALMLKQNTEPLPRPKQFVPGLPQEVERVIYKALAKDPQQRYKNMGSYASALERLTVFSPNHLLRAGKKENVVDYSFGERLSNSPYAPKDIASKQSRHSKKSVFQTSLLLGIVGIGLAVIVLIGTLSWLQNRQSKPVTEVSFQTIEAIGQETLSAIGRQTPTLFLQGEYIDKGDVTVTKTPGASKTPSKSKTPSATPEPRSGATCISNKDKMVSVYVPSGEFLMGSTDSNGSEEEMPQHNVYLDGYWIDKTEITNGQYQKCVVEKVCVEPGSSNYTIAKYANHPVGNVDWNQAKGYCEWVGGRLPSEAEWEKAARGENGRKFPWGKTDPTCGLANYSSCGGYTKPVGSLPDGVSPYGAMDMAGNVWEWVNDWYDENYYQKSPGRVPTGSSSGQYRILRGGSWGNESWFARTTARHWNDPDLRLANYGFRCVRLP